MNKIIGVESRSSTPRNLCEISDVCKISVVQDNVSTFGDGYCNTYSSLYNTEGCCWDGGDCMRVFDDCVVTPETCSGDINALGNGSCERDWLGFTNLYYNEGCCWDGGDCTKPAPVDPVDIGGILVIGASLIVVFGLAFWFTLHNRNNYTSTARPPAESSLAPSITAEERRSQRR